ncbi:A-kinase anchor protein 5 [Peromyscus californicus insignis]|uniref:A-kinase anchor protein 5 n=1 Tax=Peromyscus californicus insignis TaxID=564181 RepID=UPI0022A7B71F|nr:A-kinase anchor protein 5 [Peromyscus californicus insignis]XP_052595519.1 A-kinase anchor protein 5 [Peromyscus californicus insignis]XP_052595520.1 A-kinase anchor protein 5 [Peromyscus californicus insignis]
MKECSVKMESRVSEIQIETKEEKVPVAVSPQEERQEGKTGTLCFKRRKKANRMKPKAGSKTAEVTKKRPPEAGDSAQPQPAGAWASIKRLVTHRKRSESSKKQKPSEADVQPEDVALPKKKAKSRLRIPCIRFSRGAKRRHHSKLTEDSDYNSRVQGGADDLETKTQTQSADQAIPAKSTQGRQEGVLVEDGKEVQESCVSNSVTSRENVVSVDLELENESSAVQMGTPVLEKQSVQTQQASPLESSEAGSPRPVASDAPASPATAYQRSVEEPSGGIQESVPRGKDDGIRRSAAQEKKSGEITLGPAEETTVIQAEEAAVSQTDKSAVAQAEGGKPSQAEEAAVSQTDKSAVAQAEGGKPSQAEEAAVSQRDKSAVAQAEGGKPSQAEEAAVSQRDKSAVAQAEGGKPSQAEETVSQTDKSAVAQAEESKLSQAQETVRQTEKSAVAQAVEATVAQAVEAAVTQEEEAAVTQADKTAVTQEEEAAVARKEEAAVSRADEAAVAREEEAAVAREEEIAVAREEEAAVAQEEEAAVSRADEAAVAREEEIAVAQVPDLKENGTDTEKPRSEESKRMEPIAIIITDTEISEFDAKKSKNVPKQFLISMENEQVGVFANDSDFEGRTSEQYETLLIETASSLVKNAIQLSVEQLVNEMVSEDNKINTLLQ